MEERITIRINQIRGIIAALLVIEAEADPSDFMTDAFLQNKGLHCIAGLVTTDHIADRDVDRDRQIATVGLDGEVKVVPALEQVKG